MRSTEPTSPSSPTGPRTSSPSSTTAAAHPPAVSARTAWRSTTSSSSPRTDRRAVRRPQPSRAPTVSTWLGACRCSRWPSPIPRDVPGAAEGGADRLHLAARGSRWRCRPSPRWSRRCAARPTCRCSCCCGSTTPGPRPAASSTRLVGLAEDYLGVRREGRLLRVPRRRPRGRRRDLHGPRRAAARGAVDVHPGRRRQPRPTPFLAAAAHPPGLVAVRSAGSPRGLEVGYDDLLATAESDPSIAANADAGRRPAAEHVPWFVRRGARSSTSAAGAAGRLREGVRRRRLRPLVAALLDDAMERL